MQYLKAFFAALVAFTGQLQVATIDNNITLHEWVTIAGYTLGALAVVWGIPNSKDYENV